MGFFVIRNSLAVKGGSVQIGADTNLYRDSANVLKTDDALTVVGTLTAAGAQTHTGALTQTGPATYNGSVNFAGTPFKVPYATSSPTLGANGDLRMYLKVGIPYLAVQIGGTAYAIALPKTTDGTITVTANSLP